MTSERQVASPIQDGMCKAATASSFCWDTTAYVSVICNQGLLTANNTTKATCSA